jgi:UDP-N-acetylglucosamine 2-epimerase
MPEELNRVLVDHLSSLLLAPSRTAVDQLAAEGITQGVHQVGDVMAEAVAWGAERARAQSQVLQTHALDDGGYLLVTVHRAENTDQPDRLAAILDALDALPHEVVFPVHPRTRKALQALNGSVRLRPGLRLIEPVGYLDMLRLTQSAQAVLTDSGGVQKEAYWLARPCITLRDSTEWVETVEAGWNRLVGADTQRIVTAVRELDVPRHRPRLYGEGDASRRIAALV